MVVRVERCWRGAKSLAPPWHGPQASLARSCRHLSCLAGRGSPIARRPLQNNAYPAERGFRRFQHLAKELSPVLTPFWAHAIERHCRCVRCHAGGLVVRHRPFLACSSQLIWAGRHFATIGLAAFRSNGAEHSRPSMGLTDDCRGGIFSKRVDNWRIPGRQPRVIGRSSDRTGHRAAALAPAGAPAMRTGSPVRSMPARRTAAQSTGTARSATARAASAIRSDGILRAKRPLTSISSA